MADIIDSFKFDGLVNNFVDGCLIWRKDLLLYYVCLLIMFIESQRFCNIVKLKNLINNTVIGEMTKSQNGMENRLANGVAQFHWKAYLLL